MLYPFRNSKYLSTAHGADSMKKLILLILVLSLLLTGLPLSVSAQVTKPAVDATAVILMEASTGQILYEKNANAPLPMASTTKIMTCLVVLEHCDPNEVITVPTDAVGVEGSSAYLRHGEQISIIDLLYCLMLRSANDAASALAIHTAGSIEEFARLMNEKAQKLGLENSHFTNPHGLDHEEHYASAADLAKLTAHALENESFCRIVSTKSYLAGSGENQRALTNHNRLLYSLEGCIGVKTGYTIRSGRCLVSACKREDTTLICVTINCRADWQSHKDLYSYGFSKVKRVLYSGFEGTLPVAGSTLRVPVYAEGYALLTEPESQVSFSLNCPHFLFAPIDKGERVGQVLVVLNGTTIDTIPIYAEENLVLPPEKGPIARFFSAIISFFQGLFHT